MSPEERFAKAKFVRELYKDFIDFYRDAMEYLGFSTTWMQEDIARFMADESEQYLMVQAQRGEAKSTTACIFGVWNLTQDPSYRVMLISGARDKATENGVLCYRLITQWPVLDYLAPDKFAGDRTAVDGFDVHYILRGIPEKSASVNCLGITASLQGYRADLLIPDDIETNKNGLTATQRQHLELLSREFTSICADGRIIYLGTPQTQDSIYNGLPARGFKVRIWPGRFPTVKEEPRYNGCLAPSLIERMHILGPQCRTGRGADGTRGWNADPDRYTEDQLVRKELDQGATFQLQTMLDTSAVDAERRRLKLRDLIFADLSHDNVPEQVFWAAESTNRIVPLTSFSVPNAEMYRPAGMSTVCVKLECVTMYLDPAGSGSNEVAYAIGGVAGPYVHLLCIGGMLGGLTVENMEILVKLCEEYSVQCIHVEKNFGAGTATLLLTNFIKGIATPGGTPRLPNIGIEESNSTGQKERRIIDTLYPVLSRHKLIVHQSAVQHDASCNTALGLDVRNLYSAWYQLHNITADKGSLSIDDRLDSLSGLVKVLAEHLVKDELVAADERAKASMLNFINNPMQYRVSKTPYKNSVQKLFNRRGLL